MNWALGKLEIRSWFLDNLAVNLVKVLKNFFNSKCRFKLAYRKIVPPNGRSLMLLISLVVPAYHLICWWDCKLGSIVAKSSKRLMGKRMWNFVKIWRSKLSVNWNDLLKIPLRPNSELSPHGWGTIRTFRLAKPNTADLQPQHYLVWLKAVKCGLWPQSNSSLK